MSFDCFCLSADCHVLNLQEICRYNIRSLVKQKVCAEFPTILRPQRKQRPPKPKRAVGRRGRLVNLVPMQMGMMILNNFNDSSDEIDDDDDDDEDDDRALNESGTLKTSDEDINNEDEEENDHSHEEEEEDEGFLRAPSTTNGTMGVRLSGRSEQNVKRKLRQDSIKEETETEAAAEAMKDWEIQEMKDWEIQEEGGRPGSKPSTNTDNKRSSPSSLHQDGDGDTGSKRMRCVDMSDREDAEEGEAAAENGNGAALFSGQTQPPQRELSSEDSDLDNMEMESLKAAFQAPPTPTSVLNALHLLSIPRKARCSSSTSVDTSETSGFGSFGEEPLDIPGLGGDRDSPPSTAGGRDFTRSMSGEGDSPPSSVEDAGLEALASLEEKVSAGKVSSDSDTSGESSASPAQHEGPSLGQLMKERIQGLPLPQALRAYLTYYRN